MTFYRPLDILIVIIVIGLSGFVLLNFRQVPGSTAEVFVKERKVALFNLNAPQQVKAINTPIGQIHIQYGQGAIQVLKTPCPQKICLLHGAIRHTYDQIICIPAFLTIRINNPNGSPNQNTIDAITY